VKNNTKKILITTETHERIVVRRNGRAEPADAGSQDKQLQLEKQNFALPPIQIPTESAEIAGRQDGEPK
jgi:hypothetical protein